MAPVGLALPAFLLVEQLELVGIVVAVRPADPVPLRLQEPLQGRRLGLAALGQVLRNPLNLRGRAPLQLRAKVGDILLGEQGDACRNGRGNGARIANGILKLLQRGVLAAFAERLERFFGAVGLGPNCRDRHDLLVKPRCAGSVQGEAAEEDDARLRTLAADDAGPMQVGLEAVGLEAREQPPHQPMLKVDLHHIAGVGAVRQDRRLERD